MSNYSIGLSGLNSNSAAIDTISNNIANASTVGYKAGEYIFQDQFYKAINPLDPARAGQGTAKQNIRRLMNMGTVQDSQNTLDMAITGSMGMFRLSDANDPDTVYYTRNGQFAVSKEVDPNFPKRSYIVNQNGMFLTGYSSQDGTTLGDAWTDKITMPPTELEPRTTTLSTVAVNLDARTNTYLPAGDVPFDPEVPSSYNNKVSQTVYSADDNGGAHTMTLYYRRVDDQDMSVTYDGTNFYFPASEIAKNPLGASQANVVLTNDTSDGVERISAPHRETNVNGAVTAGDGTITVDNGSDIEQYARILINGRDASLGVSSVTSNVVTLDRTAAGGIDDDAKIEFFNPATTATASSITGTTVTLPAANIDIEEGQFVFFVDTASGDLTRLKDANGVPITVESGASTATLTLSGTPDPAVTTVGNPLVFFNPVAYRLTMQDGAKVSMSGDLLTSADSTHTQAFTAVTTKYEIYGSLDDKFYNALDNNFYSDVEFPAPIGDGTYKPIAEMQFWGGKNIDALVTNPVTGIPTFESQVTLTGKVTTPGNTAENTDPDLIFTLDLTGTRNFATPFGVDQSTQDGRSVALLNSVTISDAGEVVGTYGDGRTFLAGQVVLVNFAATDGLVPSGNNVFAASYLSGDEVHPNVIVGKPGQKGLGGIRAGAVEGSNVDLANELVKLLIQQRMYSANSQSIRAFDDTLTTTIRMAGG
ncbi:flagellar hook-basal body complex protein [Betaproteobacteria bacterium LSUCC0115]|nr:flagellar hook-basal body complex protein [Burkholderiales bacterium LSUCC0115]